ncbi:DKNYY family protein [Chitinophaga sp. 180180018-2]|uniref:DKNYY domain-containing protein n=2 Tax=Chitinophaga TaxID=79328 RepID=UPI002DE31102|nr:DKNYY family protein [Chitinophaga sp. 212800010-3]
MGDNSITMIHLAEAFDELDDKTFYWTDGKNVFYRNTQIKGAAVDSFVHFRGVWAKDVKNCYSCPTKLRGADPHTFDALNLTFAKDKESVWTLAGKIKDADAETFVVCDEGEHSFGNAVKHAGSKTFLHESFAPYGFGKDKSNVYYFDFQGKTKIVKKANPETFVSFNDSYFGYDEKQVFCGFAVIPGADPATWIKLKKHYYYSKDKNKIFYFNRWIKEADSATFEIVDIPFNIGQPLQLARDKNRAYWNDREISFEELDRQVKKRARVYHEVTELLK